MNNKEKTINDFKPRKWLVVLLIIIALAIAVVLINKGITIYNEKLKNKKSLWTIGEKTEEQFNEINNQINEARKNSEIDSFNSPFEIYTGTKTGNSVSWLLDKIVTNNKKSKEHIITVEFTNHNTTDPEEIINIKTELDDWHEYEVSLDYSEEGYVNKVTIK